MRLNINSDAAIAYTVKLERLHRSALPVAVRGTLNKAAFYVKQTTMQQSADRHFIKRKPNFFKANSRVEKAVGFEINGMKSTIGFVPRSANGYNNWAVRDLQEQEYGGVIGHRSFLAENIARGGNIGNMVRAGSRLSDIKNVVDAEKSKGSTEKEKFVKAAIHAGPGGFVLGSGGLYKVGLINRIKGRKKGNDRSRFTKVKAIKLYSFRKGRKVNIKATVFFREATLKSASQMDKFYAEEAKRQFAKIKVK